MISYDMAFSMGFSCGGTMALRRVGMQYASYPLDWIGSPGIVASAKMIASDFAGWFEKEDLQLVAVRGGSFQNNVYQNRKTRFGFPHDFPRFFRFDEKYPETAEKYARRVRRFQEELARAKTALAIYVERPINPRAPDADLLEARRILEMKYPEVKFEIIYFYLDEKQRIFDEAVLSRGITTVGCNYVQYDHGEKSHAIDADVIAGYFRGIFRVPDRRTEEEKAAYERDRKAARKRRFGGKLNALKYRLYRWLERDLQERGLVPRDFPLWFD